MLRSMRGSRGGPSPGARLLALLLLVGIVGLTVPAVVTGAFTGALTVLGVLQ